jgi:hypothetical protein
VFPSRPQCATNLVPWAVMKLLFGWIEVCMGTQSRNILEEGPAPWQLDSLAEPCGHGFCSAQSLEENATLNSSPNCNKTVQEASPSRSLASTSYSRDVSPVSIAPLIFFFFFSCSFPQQTYRTGIDYIILSRQPSECLTTPSIHFLLSSDPRFSTTACA